MDEPEIQLEGWLDRAKSQWQGVKTGVSNVAKTANAAYTGKPVAGTKQVTHAKVETRFKLSKNKIDSLVKNSGVKKAFFSGKLTPIQFNYQDLISGNKQLETQVAINKEMINFIDDLAKLMGKSNSIDALLQINTDPAYKNISNYLKRAYATRMKRVPGTPVQTQPQTPTSAPISQSPVAQTPAATPPTQQPTIPENIQSVNIKYKEFFK